MRVAYKGNLKEVMKNDAGPGDLLSVDEVANLCGMTHSRVCQLLRSGQMKGIKWRGIVWQIQRKEAEKFRERPIAAGRPRIG